jgi:hypothetical protein
MVSGLTARHVSRCYVHFGSFGAQITAIETRPAQDGLPDFMSGFALGFC